MTLLSNIIQIVRLAWTHSTPLIFLEEGMGMNGGHRGPRGQKGLWGQREQKGQGGNKLSGQDIIFGILVHSVFQKYSIC